MEVDPSAARKGFRVPAMGVRKILIQLSWRLLKFQPESDLVLWFKKRTANAQGSRKSMIVALARKLIIVLWRYVNTGLVPEGFQLRSAA
jgi:transposase